MQHINNNNEKEEWDNSTTLNQDFKNDEFDEQPRPATFMSQANAQAVQKILKSTFTSAMDKQRKVMEERKRAQMLQSPEKIQAIPNLLSSAVKIAIPVSGVLYAFYRLYCWWFKTPAVEAPTIAIE